VGRNNRSRRTRFSGIYCFLVLSLFCENLTFGAGRGPVFPSHRYPTDESFHFSFASTYLATRSNFSGPLTSSKLTDDSSVGVIRFSPSGEFQPNRRFSVGGTFNFDSVRLSIPNEIEGVSKSGLSDQIIWGEFRFFDKPGASIGLGIVAKFPLYTNPSLADLDPDNPPPTAFLGDAQTDITTLITTEFWSNYSLRIRANLGYTARFSGFGSELPFLLSLGYVTPKVDFDLGLRGNLALKKVTDPISPESEKLNDLRATFKDSRYALSENPWVLIIEPKFEFWLTPTWAFQFRYAYTWMGNRSALFNEFLGGVVYRWAQKKSNRQKTFQQVDISTDQEAGTFQAESQSKSLEPKAVDPEAIKEGSDEEFF
jgi:hypothetical protein